MRTNDPIICPRQGWRTRRRRAGIALILVLSLIAFMLPFLVGMARLVVVGRVELVRLHNSRIADDLAIGGTTEAIRGWLRHKAPSCALPLSSRAPLIAVFDETWLLDDERVARVRIIACDLRGSVSAYAVMRDSPLAGAAPTWARRMISDHASDFERRGGRCGPDWFVGERSSPNERHIYPRSVDDDRALASVVGCGGASAEDIRININAAPIDLVDEAARLAGIDVRSVVRAARARGEPAPLNTRQPSSSVDSGVPVRLIDSSDRWAFRVDAWFGPTARVSWWREWELEGGDWKEMQRVIIAE